MSAWPAGRVVSYSWDYPLTTQEKKDLLFLTYREESSLIDDQAQEADRKAGEAQRSLELLQQQVETLRKERDELLAACEQKCDQQLIAGLRAESESLRAESMLLKDKNDALNEQLRYVQLKRRQEWKNSRIQHTRNVAEQKVLFEEAIHRVISRHVESGPLLSLEDRA
mmetsp:Transcript_43226/g.78658  ORF Transcript_43226/g.78658 Transcript_43226/m.78658 type:complete len:168 (-) Transcript_43226:77-580(-)